MSEVRMNRSFKNVFQGVLLTHEGRKDFPQAGRNGLK